MMHAQPSLPDDGPSELTVEQERRVTALLRAKHVLREEEPPVLVNDLIELAEWILDHQITTDTDPPRLRPQQAEDANR